MNCNHLFMMFLSFVLHRSAPGEGDTAGKPGRPHHGCMGDVIPLGRTHPGADAGSAEATAEGRCGGD